VEKIIEDLKSGKKDHEDFWIKMGEKYVYIRYFAVRNEKGEYLGTIEVTQDIAPIQKLQVRNDCFLMLSKKGSKCLRKLGIQ